jgi:hypothetical protein
MKKVVTQTMGRVKVLSWLKIPDKTHIFTLLPDFDGEELLGSGPTQGNTSVIPSGLLAGNVYSVGIHRRQM